MKENFIMNKISFTKTNMALLLATSALFSTSASAASAACTARLYNIDRAVDCSTAALPMPVNSTYRVSFDGGSPGVPVNAMYDWAVYRTDGTRVSGGRQTGAWTSGVKGRQGTTLRLEVKPLSFVNGEDDQKIRGTIQNY